MFCGGPLMWWGILAIAVGGALVIVAAVVVVLCRLSRSHQHESETSSDGEMTGVGAGRIKTIELTNDWSTERTETVGAATWDDY